jgi:hypothetical protein
MGIVHQNGNEMKTPRLLHKETLFEKTHEGQGRIMESDGFYYAEAKKCKVWKLVQFSEFSAVARLALDHYLAEEF